MCLAESETRSGLFWNLWFHKIWGVCYLAAEFLRRTLLRVVVNLKPNSARKCYLILYCSVILVIRQTRDCFKINVGYPKAAAGAQQKGHPVINGSRDSIGDIAPTLRPGLSGIRTLTRQLIYLFSKMSRPSIVPTQSSFQWVPAFLPEGKAAGV
jgi:hypothetical protein